MLGWVGGMITTTVSSDEMGLLALGVSLAIGLLIGGFTGHGARHLWGRYCFAPKRFLENKIQALRKENQFLRERWVIEDWEYELNKFGLDAGPFWGIITDALEDRPEYSTRKALRAECDRAEWPDWWVEGKVGLHTLASEAFPVSGHGLLGKGLLDSFDIQRRALASRLERWARRIGDPHHQNISDFLHARVKPQHEPTLKLLWYLDIAYAERIGGTEKADHSAYEAVRDAFNCTPQEGTGNEEE